MNTLAPVLIFCYKRLDTLKQTVTALKKNALAVNTDLFIFSDGGKTEDDKIVIGEIRNYIRSISGFKSVTPYNSLINKGLANSIIDGVSKVVEEYGKVIVLEDDLITSNNFLQYMNAALTNYEDTPRVFSISGYSFPISVKSNYPFDNYFTKRGSSWGWATWKDRWNRVDWKVSDYGDFLEQKSHQRSFNAMGSDLTGMLRKQMEGKINSWAIRWVYHQFKYDLYTVYPIESKVENIGFGAGATHTNERFSRYKTKHDQTGNINFRFNPKIGLEDKFVKQFIYRYSIFQRAIYKALNFFN
jgi:hypothetical protein